jgi:hypothetical protein
LGDKFKTIEGDVVKLVAHFSSDAVSGIVVGIIISGFPGKDVASKREMVLGQTDEYELSQCAIATQL